MKPSAWAALSESGTRVEVRDLFFATPARLKFMKSERAEMMAVTDVVKRLAMARPDVAFSLEHDGRMSLRLGAERDPENEGRRARLAAILGADFAPNCIRARSDARQVRLSGFAGLPTFHRGTREHQHLFVNGRPVKDKLIVGAVRAAYQDLLARDRHPVAALFLDLPPGEVDVNVHPAKTEVRFRDAALVRGLIVGALEPRARRRRPSRFDDDGAERARRRARRTKRRSRRAARVGRGGGALGAGDFMMPSGRVERLERRRLAGELRAHVLRARDRRRDAGAPTIRKTRASSRSARRARRSTRPTSSRRPRTASSSSISTPRTSGSSTSA